MPTSANSYTLIPLEGERDSRPAPQHADLSLKLREPQIFEAELLLLDLSGTTDANAPNLSGRFEPEFVETYTVHDWNWGANREGNVLSEVNLVAIKTTPGQPVFIPQKGQEIYRDDNGKYYAVVLYATKDGLTFAYTRDGTVANGYSVQFQGLQTDPNLLALYRESKGNQLPGLTLDTPVGLTTDKLIVAVRDRGKFMDVRSRKDWWR